MIAVRRRFGHVHVLAVAIATFLCLPTTFAFGADTVDVPPSIESWYQTSVTGGPADPLCGQPTGCAPSLSAPVSVFPEDTLHVGLVGGVDDAHVFLTLDVDALPAGADVVGGVLTLPVLTDPASGSLQPEIASLVACEVMSPFEQARGGSPDEAPDYDCGSSSLGVYDAEVDPPVFAFNLRFIVDAALSGGLAIVPTSTARINRDTFRVVFPTVEHGEDTIVAAFDLAATVAPSEPLAPTPTPTPEPDDAPSPVATTPAPTQSQAPSRPAAPVTFQGPGVSTTVTRPAPAPIPTPEVALGVSPSQPEASATTPQETVAAPVAAIASPYKYPGIWLTPFLILAMVSVLARALTEPVLIEDDA